MIQILDEATEELLAATQWYDSEREGLGDELLTEIHNALTSIQETPTLWPIISGSRGARRFVCQRFPYIVYYLVRNDAIWIVAIAHSSRQPGYWHYRLKH